MFDVIWQSFGIQLIYALVGSSLGWLSLVWLDRRLEKGTSAFARHFQAMQGDPVALGTYFGLRWLGLCYIIGQFIHG